jgi:CheY-like chemotaxis protein/GAF domain-containing protein
MGGASDGDLSSIPPGPREALAHGGPEPLVSPALGGAQFGSQRWAILERIARGASLEELLESIVGLVEQDGQSMSCSILLVDTDGKRLRHGAALRFPAELSRYVDGMLISSTAGSCGAAAFRRQAVIVTDIGTHPNWTEHKLLFLARGLCACWSSPIFAPDGEVLGTLAVYFRERRGPTPGEHECVAAATHLSSIALSRAHAEREHQRLLRALGERVKELTLLHRSARLLQAPERPPRELLGELVELLPGGWQYPEICQARILWGALELQTPGYADTPWKQGAAQTAGEYSVRVEVVYSREMPEAAEGPFLLEERHLIQSLADLCAAYLERHLAEQALKGSLAELREANQRLELQVTCMPRAQEESAALGARLRHAQRMQALGTLAGGIAHDFNNILTAITGHTFLALTDLEDGGSTQESLLAIQEASLRAVELVRRILTFSRHGEPKREPASLQPIVQDAVQLLSATVPPSIRIQTQFDSKGPVAYVDAGLPQRSAPERSVRAQFPEAAAASALAARAAPPGAGLPGARGAPVVARAGLAPAVSLGAEPRPADFAVGAGRMRVLYVDDEEPLVALAKRFLERLGHRVTGFSDPALALEAFREHPDDFDAVISDLSMPGLSGLDMLREILTIRPSVIVVMSSGDVRPEDQQAAHELGAVGVVSKPQSMAEFGDILQRILEQQAKPQ